MKNLYRKKRPTRDFHHHVLDVLRMNEQQFAQFQGVADHFLGNQVFHEHLPRYPPQKILPSSFQHIVDVDSPSTLAAMMHMEQIAHNDHSIESHMGGGLVEAGRSLFDGLWNLIGFGPELSGWFGFYDYNAPENKPTLEDNKYAAIVQQAYKPIDQRVDSLFGGDWVRDTAMDDDQFSVWVDDSDKQVHVALRGTKLNYADLASDLNIVLSNASGNVPEIRAFLEKVVEKYGDDFVLDVSGHSLGGNELMELFEGDDLEGFDRVNLFNPGVTPTHNLDSAKDAVADERVHFYLNSGDLISNAFVSMIPSERDNVVWVKPTHSPMTNHGVSQWNPDQVEL